MSLALSYHNIKYRISYRILFSDILQDLSSMSGPDISALVSELPVPQDGKVEAMSVDDAVKVA